MNKPYQRKIGDFEIRILPDGRVVFVAPDEQLTEVAEALDQLDTANVQAQENHDHAG